MQSEWGNLTTKCTHLLCTWVLDCDSQHTIFSIPYSWVQRILLFSSHYGDVMMTRMASWITSLTIVYSIVYSGVDQRKLQSSTSLAFVRWIHRRPVNSPHKCPVTRKMFPFDDVIMKECKMNRTSVLKLFYILNCLGNKKYIYISCHSSILTWHR